MFQIHFPKPLKTSCWKKKKKKNREHIPTKGSSVTPEILDKIFSEKRILQYLKEKSGDNMTVFINENKRRLAEDSPPPIEQLQITTYQLTLLVLCTCLQPSNAGWQNSNLC